MNKDIKWIIEVTVLAFIITVLFSIGSQILLEDVHVIIGIIIIVVFIVIGVLFDIIGVAVQSSDATAFHAMASKKIKSAGTAKKMLENSKVKYNYATRRYELCFSIGVRTPSLLWYLSLL